jgi:WD40 repeat protein
MNSKDLICKFKDCKLILENPVTLPCGNSICKHHLEQFEDQCQKYNCVFCQDEHEIPKNGFGINKIIALMIQNYFESDPLRKKIIESFDNLIESVKDYQNIEPDNCIYDYFANIINQVDLHREELIKEINDRSEEIIKQLKEKEKFYKLNAPKLSKIDLNKIETWKKEMRRAEKNQNELNKLFNDIDNENNEIKKQTKQTKNNLLFDESIEFKKIEKSSLFGQLIIISKIDSVLSANCGELIREYRGHSDWIRSIQVDEKSNKLITCSYDETIKIWNLHSGECLKTLNEHKNNVNCILIIPNNKFISSSDDKTIKIWDLNSYKCLNTLKNEFYVESLCLISDNQIACGCWNGTINIWNIANSTKVKSFKAHDSWIACLLLTDLKTNLISCSRDGTIKIWNLKKFECIKELEAHSNIVRYLKLTSKGDFISCSEDKTVKLWKKETGQLLKSIQFDQPVNFVQKLKEDLIAVALQNGEIHIYNLVKIEKIKTIQAHSFGAFRLNFLSNGNLLSGSEKGEIKQLKIFD